MILKNKKVFITGATSGLGFSISKLLVKKGCKVYGVGKSKKGVKEAKKKLKSSNFTVYSADVSDFKQISDVIKKVGKIDILINNAGVWLSGQLQDNKVEKISKTIDINLKGVIYTTKAVLPQMIKRKTGYIFNISSTSGLRGKNEQSVYVASKYGVTGFTKSLQRDLWNTNIKVAGFYPGGMKTKLFSKAGTILNNKNWMNTDKVALIIVFMLERDDTMIMDHVVVNRRLK